MRGLWAPWSEKRPCYPAAVRVCAREPRRMKGVAVFLLLFVFLAPVFVPAGDGPLAREPGVTVLSAPGSHDDFEEVTLRELTPFSALLGGELVPAIVLPVPGISRLARQVPEPPVSDSVPSCLLPPPRLV